MVTHYPSAPISCTEVPPNAGQVSQVTAADSRYAYSDSAIHVLKNVHISAQLTDDFLELARNNTNNDLETCGVLGASLKEETFYATTLIIPKQKSTSSSALREEEIFNIQNDRSLFPVGWIHTHPSQSCFMSSIDLHTQYPYQLAVAMQVMVPEAIAIVVAPTDKTRNYGIFRLTDPSGMNVVKECEENGFHPHRDSTDGRPLYEQCSHVYINPNLRFEIFDLR
ncbi:AMSH-like ubiquitin thioesterase 2 isoform X2 [Beta vulgaris subsp. vulgaris]|uniref:AMSH-like ubiquitin thioesterase 2 isoform X2 n=1 Tax=Beta vulgaris subsp. vulgaris TaxID=3555 RepID=UPI0020374A7F|nr:AMSH-like ubiquitin thioesterase 2 isoform X2 [Beta vulgaris subsp. vulgaris]